ncbi:MAG: S41 family peptidase [Fuerstiella sp.]
MQIAQTSVVMVVIWMMAVPVATAQLPRPLAQRAPLEHQLMAVIDAIMEHHIDPPTRQQLVLDALRRAAFRYEKDLPLGLAGEISVASAESLIDILRRHLRQMSAGRGMVIAVAGDGRALADTGSGRRISARATIRSVGLSDLMPADVQTTSTEVNRINEQLEANRYVGIGIRLTVNRETRRSQMIEVIPNGPAGKAGARNGDLIMQIDGQQTDGKTLANVVKLLRGLKGSTVEVVLKQPGQAELRTYTLTRGVVPFTSVSAVAVSDDGRACGILIKQVTASTVHELRKKEAELGDDIGLVVLDVRRLRNHNLHNARLLANALLDSEVVGSVDTMEGNQQFSAEPGRLFADRQLVLLIGSSTVGTIEWIAAALQDRQQAILIGTPTPGRAFVSETIPTSQPDLLIQLPTGRLRSADGRRLDLPRDRSSPDLSSFAATVQTLREADAVVKRFTGRTAPSKSLRGVEPDIADIRWKSSNSMRDGELRAVVERVAKLVLDKGEAAASKSGD